MENGGMETYLTRVEHWECDFNGHWNTRFYGHAFDQAARVVAASADLRSTDSDDLTWHVRFHRELVSADLVQVFSSNMLIEGNDAAVLHVLENDARISATALQLPGPDAPQLPEADKHQLQQAMPKGLGAEKVDWRNVEDRAQHVAMLGLLDASEVDAAGRLGLGEVLAYCGRASHAHREVIGIGPSYTRRTGISPMLVEMRVCLNSNSPLGAPVKMASRLLRISGKSFVSAHSFQSVAGNDIARIELCLLAVDTTSRKAVEVPAFLSEYAN